MEPILNPNVRAALEDLIKALDSKLFKAFTDPTRTQILEFLILNGRADIRTIADHLPQDRSVISRHLNLMAEAGILVATKETRHRFYCINCEAFLREFENITNNLRICIAQCCRPAG